MNVWLTFILNIDNVICQTSLSYTLLEEQQKKKSCSGRNIFYGGIVALSIIVITGIVSSFKFVDIL